MAYIIDGPRITRHVSFSPKEDNDLRKRAAKVGMEVVPFIRQQALHGMAKGYQLSALIQHATQIGEIAKTVREIADRPHPDRWLYEADLEAIEDKLDELIAIEKHIAEQLQKRLR